MINNTSENNTSLKVSFFRKYYIIGIKLNSKGGAITRMLNLDKVYISQFIYFIGSKFYCVIDCLKINGFTICREKCLDTVV